MDQELLSFYEAYKQKVSAYYMAMSIMYFDQATIAPEHGAEAMNDASALLSGEVFKYANDPANVAKIEKLYEQAEDPILKRELALTLKDLHEQRDIPADLYMNFHRAVAQSEHVWRFAKEQNNYEMFKPYLMEVVKLQKEVVSYTHTDKTIYNKLLDDYEEGTSETMYDEFFALVKEKLVPLIHEIQACPKQIDNSIFFEHYPKEKQEAFIHELMDYMHVDTKEEYMGQTEHPFTMQVSAHDVRISTHYYENNLMSAILSFIHENGHATFGLQINESYYGGALASHLGSGLHESQSRFMENHIGRHPVFWEVNYPKLQAIFPNFKDIPLETFMAMLNKCEPSLIRTEADELTYPLHILIRYEIEKMMFNDGIDYDELPAIWNAKYKEYLGIDVDSDTHGVLQDMHWSAADLGYFPTYALGSAYAAQFYQQMEKEIDVADALRNDFTLIKDWLKTHIHHYGAEKSANKILLEVTGETFNPNYYIDYLTNKYRKLYELD